MTHLWADGHGPGIVIFQWGAADIFIMGRLTPPERYAALPLEVLRQVRTLLPLATRPTWLRWLVRITLWMVGLATAAAVGLALTIAVALAVAYPNLPDISDLADYRPKLPLRVYSAEGALLGEFGEERRNLTPIGEIPKVMKDAVLAIEDARFFQHGGVDYKGVMRAGLA